MELSTERLMLCNYTLNDLDSFFKLKSDERVWLFSTYTPINSYAKAKDELTELLVNKSDYTFKSLHKKDTGEFNDIYPLQ